MDSGGPIKHVLDGAKILHEKGQLLGERKGMTDDTLPWAAKWLNRSICRLAWIQVGEGRTSTVVFARWR